MTPAVRIVARDRVDRLGEGPLWSARDNALYWVDILGQRLNRLTLADSAVTSWAMPDMIGWVIERRDRPGFIAGLRRGVAALTLDPLAIAMRVAVEPDLPQNRLNDAKADGQGRIFFGTMPVAIDGPSGNLWRHDPDGSLTRLDAGYTVANGPAISADGRWLYHTDSVPGRIYRFALAADGSLGERTLFRQFGPGEGKPDGMTFDSDGGLWVACWGAGRIVRLDAHGTIDDAIALPASQISSVAFAGPGLDRLFVTSAADGVAEPHGGALFEVAAGRTGLPPERFAG